MNILFVIGGLELGGAQTFALRLASYLKKQGHNIFVYNTHPEKFDPDVLNHLDKTIPVINAYFENLSKKFALFKLIRPIVSREKFDAFFLKKLIKKHNIQIINTHLYLADLYIKKLNIKPDKDLKIISSWHGCYNLLINDYAVKNKLRELQIKTQQIFKNYNLIIFAADRHLEAYKQLQLSVPYTKIYYGFPEPKNIKPADFDKNNAFVFGMIARGDPTKGWTEAIEAFRQVKKQVNRKLKLVLVGRSEYLEKLKSQYNNPDIIFAGQTNNPLGWIYHFDVGLLPTYFPAESLPNTIIEYLAMQKPVIATNWAEIPQMIDSPKGKSGILIPLAKGKPDINALTDAMLNLIRDKNLYRQLAENAKFAFEKFSMQHCAEQYLQTFQKLTNDPVPSQNKNLLH